jgi:hypothetical protein
LLRIPELNELYLDRSLDGMHLDEVWWLIDLVALGVIHPDTVPDQSKSALFKPSDELRTIHERMNATCTLGKLLDLILNIADGVMEAPPDYGGQPAYWVEGIEGTLWRAFDGLKAVQLLAREGLMAGAQIEFRAAQEALFLHMHFRAKKKNAKVFKQSSMYEEASDISDFIRFYKQKHTRIFPEHVDMLKRAVSDLNAIQLPVKIEPDYSLSCPGTIPTKRPTWRSLVPINAHHLLFKGQEYRAYFDIFSKGNRSAHSLAAGWGGWVETEAGVPKVIGSVKGTAKDLPTYSIMTLRDFVGALMQSRPQLPDCYDSWLVTWHKRLSKANPSK